MKRMIRYRILRKVRHILHCCLMLGLIFAFIRGTIETSSANQNVVDPFGLYGVVVTILLYTFRLLPLLALPQSVVNFLGLLLYDTFPGKVKLKVKSREAPFICIRTVTRGDYPDLVRSNVERNIRTCLSVGMDRFIFEVVTEKAILDLKSAGDADPDRQLPSTSSKEVLIDMTAGADVSKWIKETVIPKEYKTKSGAMFKARALQYCLEDFVNELRDDDYILHLDEETLLTRDAMRGVLNFTSAGEHPFGQGLITYANERIVNWLTTLADTYRVADDLGKLRFQFRFFHKPFFSWKGSFVCCRVREERAVTFDHGPDGSIAEDCYFSMIAHSRGYTFDFIEGALWEKSPFTIKDLIQQRKRWLQGIYLVVHSQKIPFRHKKWLTCSLYAWATLPLATSNVFLAPLCPIILPQFIDVLCGFIGALNLYMYIFGVLKSFSIRQSGLLRFILCIATVPLAIPFNVIVENVSVVWGLFGKKHKFYVVSKTTTA